MQLVRFLLIVNIFFNSSFGGSLKLTNIKCKSFDTSFSDFKVCDLKVIRRGIIALDIFVKLFKTPVTRVSVNVALWKKASGYKPFLYNQSLNYCYFMKNPKRYPFFYMVHSAFINSSNVNHTCPYDHELIVNKLVLNENMLALLPLPTGEYMFQFFVGAYDIWRAELKVYVNRVESNDF